MGIIIINCVTRPSLSVCLTHFDSYFPPSYHLYFFSPSLLPFPLSQPFFLSLCWSVVVNSVSQGKDCGVVADNFNEWQEGDRIECHATILHPPKLQDFSPRPKEEAPVVVSAGNPFKKQKQTKMRHHAP